MTINHYESFLFPTYDRFVQKFVIVMKSEEVKQVLSELHNIARELNEPFDSGDVIVEYSKRYGALSAEISKAVIHPIYYPPECSIISLEG